MQIRTLGDMPTEWAFHHECDRLWLVTPTGEHLFPDLRPALYRTLDDALKCAAEMTGAQRVSFRREHDNSAGEPVISCRTGDKIVAYLEPMYLAFTMPARRVGVDDLTPKAPRGWDVIEA